MLCLINFRDSYYKVFRLLVLWIRKSNHSQAKQFLIKIILAKILRKITFFLKKVRIIVQWVRLLIENNPAIFLQPAELIVYRWRFHNKNSSKPGEFGGLFFSQISFVWITLDFTLFVAKWWKFAPQKIYIMLYGAFTLDVKSVLNENLGGILGGILGGTQCEMDHSPMLREC
jgi:hypothetical protein